VFVIQRHAVTLRSVFLFDCRPSFLAVRPNMSSDAERHSPPSSAQELEAMLQLLMNDITYVGDIMDCDNATMLMSAAYEGDLYVVKKFVECNQVHSRNVDNLQAIDIASYCGHVDIVKFLRDRLPRTNSSCISSGTGTDCNCKTSTAVDLKTGRSLLENGADVDAENVDGLRPIHWAVRSGLVELVELLIRHGANVDAADVYGNRPLHEAVCDGLNVVRLLIHHGAKVNVQNVDGKTPLHVAIERQQSEVVVFLLSADADVGLTDNWRNTPLHYLSTSDALDEFVVKQTNEPLLIRNALGVTAVSSMASRALVDYVFHEEQISNDSRIASQTDLCSKQLTHAFSASVIPCYRKESAPMDCYGNTPLHYVVGVYAHLKLYRVSTDVMKTVEFLVKRGADINARNNDGFTPLHVARGKEAMEACLQHANDQSFTVTDERGRNFWHLLFLLRNLNENASTINIGPSDAKHNSDDLNRTPLHYACMKRGARIDELTEEFIEEFSDEYINQQDSFGRTALHYAAMADNGELMELLKNKRATDDTVRDNFEKTADEYTDYYSVNRPLYRLDETSIFVSRNFNSISSCIEQCFSDISRDSQTSKTELQKLIRDLSTNDTTSFVLSMYRGCRFDYIDACRKMAAWKQYTRERLELPADDNGSATQPPIRPTFAAIQSQVDTAMHYLAKVISDKDARFACEVVPVGSAREETRIGYCDEFDYNFVLTDLSTKCEVCCSPESPPCFVLLKASAPAYDKDLFNSDGILNTRIVKFKFETLVKQILSSLSFCEVTGFEFTDPFQDFMLPSGNTSTKINTQIKLVFIKPVNGYHVPHSISVDVVPALRIDGWWPDDTRREDLCQQGDCLIVFTQPQNKYPWIGWTQPHGFISFTQAESRLLRDCPPVVKAGFMVVKRMSKYLCKYEFFSSHVIKTAVFWCLDEVDSTNECSSANDSDEVNADELLRWVRRILQRLLRFAAQDYVPSYFMPKCCQPVWLAEKYLKQFHMRLYRHGLLTCTDLFSLNEQQFRDFWLKYIKSLFLSSHVMYWTLVSDAKDLKLFVPSAVSPLTEKDVCTTRMPEY